MAHNWESVSMEDYDEGMEHYVFVEVDKDVEDDFVLTDTGGTVVETNQVSPTPTFEETRNLLEGLDFAPKDFPSGHAMVFLGSSKLKSVWILFLIVSILLLNALDLLCGIRASQRWKPDTEPIPCPFPVEARTTSEVLTTAGVREPKVSPPGYSNCSPKMTTPSPVSFDMADFYASDYNESSLGIWKEIEVPRPQMSTSVVESIPSSQHGSLTVWESRYQVQGVEPNVAVFEKAPMIPMVRWDGIRVDAGHGISLYPSLYPAVGTQESGASSPVSPPRIPMRSLIPYKAPEEPPSDRWNDVSGNYNVLHRPERLPSHMFLELASNNIPHSAHRNNGEREVVTPPEAIEPQGSVALTQYTFQEFIRQNENVLVTFYLPCERFHQIYVPLWTNFTSAVLKAKLPLVTATVNCHSHPSICREQGCYKFPTIRWFREGEVLVEDYNTGRNAEKLFLFAKEMLMKPHVPTKIRDTISYPSIQIMPPPTSHSKHDGEVDEIQARHLPTMAFVKKQRTPVITSSTTASNSLSLHRVRTTSSPCPVHSGATTLMSSTPTHMGIAVSHRLMG